MELEALNSSKPQSRTAGSNSSHVGIIFSIPNTHLSFSFVDCTTTSHKPSKCEVVTGVNRLKVTWGDSDSRKIGHQLLSAVFGVPYTSKAMIQFIPYTSLIVEDPKVHS